MDQQVENNLNENSSEVEKKIHKLNPSIVAELDNVSKTFDRKTWAVRRATLQVKRGECLALMGANGSGKTTLARLIGNVIKQTTGNVDYYFNNENIFASIGYQAREQAWPNGFRVKDIVTLWINTYNVQDQEWIARLKSIFEVEKNENKYLSKLPDVYLQLFAIFLAMLHKPEILVVDEFSSAIDFEHKTKIVALFEDYLKEDNAIVLVAPEDYILTTLVKRVVYLHHGKIIDDLSVELIQQQYQSIFNYIKTVSLSEESDEKKKSVEPSLRSLIRKYKALETQLETDYHQFVENQLAKRYEQFDLDIKNAIFLVSELSKNLYSTATSDINKESVDVIRDEVKKTIKRIKKLLKQLVKLKRKDPRLKKLTQLERDFAQIIQLLEDSLKDSLDNEKLVINGDDSEVEMSKDSKRELEILKERYIKEELKIIRLERRKADQNRTNFREVLTTKLLFRDLSKKEKNSLKAESITLEIEGLVNKAAVLDDKDRIVIKPLDKISESDQLLANKRVKLEPEVELPTPTGEIKPKSNSKQKKQTSKEVH
ncbi:hypothetical protein LD125_00228 [Mesoplasma sp. JKS002658]|uniref:ATP-binding cassette domain-containing protein n=1 Tax=Mesoplasma whartonense TaxID=2878854 RepID=UPI002022A8E5|nr:MULTISPECIES: ATP-binding cassette domain-containing protein [unclassified Mesoplasma]MCL8211261.1 hypothetical protein [Mesoplasma sp. JKS002664]MCL8211922.1 hypothetical protein [Mesoplasma sp. JKS002662]MCL8213973.1 hypothetical protein [Mesoplasma sp. JKS002658]MCL8214599.1 hypothetical protein [Mesoplasma sp. JKS002663]MCL8215292.1 hypothetical protein [Mesoplasma sp. JKS002659]